MGELGDQGTNCHKNSALGAVFSFLCPAHRSLLYQILKLAHQQKLLFFKSLFQSESCCCHCSESIEDHIIHHQATLSDCKAHNSNQHWLSPCDSGHCSKRYHPRDKSNCSTHQYPLKECKNETPRDCSSVPQCNRCTVTCPERVHCISCQSLSLTNINNAVCSFAPTAASPSVCTSSLSSCSSLSVCCNNNTQSSSCYLIHSCITQDKSTKSTENGDSACSVIKREQSPPPPPLSPIPSDLNKQCDDKPPSLLHHIQEEEAESVVKNCLIANQCKGTVKRRQCRNAPNYQTRMNASGTLLQDMVNRFSEKLETIKPLEKDVPLAPASVSEKEQLHVASRNLTLNTDAHLTEIITTVLHTGSASEYSLSELMNHHNNKEPKSPNTRSRRRQEVLAAMATPADDATTRRHTLQIKRELAMLDQSCNKRKKPKLKHLNTSMVKEECDGAMEKERAMQNSNAKVEPQHMLTTETDEGEVKDNIKAVTVKEDIKVIKAEEKEAMVLEESHSSIQGKCRKNQETDHDRHGSDSGKNGPVPSDQLNSSREARKSKRNIVPPNRFSSYVTEPRKMYFVACFSDGIFNQRSQKDEVIDQVHQENSASESTNEFSVKVDDQSKTIPPITKEKSPIKDNLDSVTDSNKCETKRSRRLQSKQLSDVNEIPSICIESPHNHCVEYTSPIKLMFVSPVKDEGGIKYSLKSAAAVNGSQAEESFDPYEESSWSGTPEKNKSPNTELATTHPTSPAKSASVSPGSASSQSKTSPTKSPSPTKSASSPKSTSSLKTGSRRSGESTPTKRITAEDTQRSPRDLLPFHDTTPPKRRPGRPKKLGPQLEKKAKRPIGRPRKQQVVESTTGKSENENHFAPDTENVNKNLKITVVYGRSRRNKRTVCEGFDQLQTEFRDACQAVGLNNNWSMLMNTAKADSGDLKTASAELSQEFPLIRPVKNSATNSKTNIKCQSLDDNAPSRKPGRPAKVKLSGISVTVTTVSPRQRKIQINKDTRTFPVKQNHKRALLNEFKSAKEPKTITRHSVSKISQQGQEMEPEVESKDEQNPPTAVRHSERVRKPSIHFLHAVATSSSYSRSSALVRRSKQLLLNKANNERKREESQSVVQTSVERQPLKKQEKEETNSPDLQQVATVSVNSIYSPKETLKWWAVSAQEKTLNQELARRIRLISDTWVSGAVDSKEEVVLGSDMSSKGSISLSRKSKCSSVVRSLFDCSPNKPRSCSMQQLCSWFMQTTETQSLSIVKKASSRNPYELMHFPRCTNKKSVCYSPQAERQRKHLKKFAKTVPKSPHDYEEAQKRIYKNKISLSKEDAKPQRSTKSLGSGRKNQRAKWSKSFYKYQGALFRARTKFLTKKERKRWMKYKAGSTLDGHVIGLYTKQKALHKPTTKQSPDCGQTLEPDDAAKDHLCSKAWCSEKLKECRVSLRKINSPDIEAAEEEWDSCTVTLDDGSPSALLFGKSEKQVGVVKAVKTEHKRSPNRARKRDLESPLHNSFHEPHKMLVRRREGRHRVRVLSESSTPPAKRLRQSRMKGLSGPRWRDFVFGN